MPAFSSNSRKALATCHQDLQRLFNEVVKHFDCTIIEGHRTPARQAELYAQGRTTPGPIVTWVRKGKHNLTPSRAVDVVPYPISWKDTPRMYYFAGFVMATAMSMGIKVRWGGDWDQDTNTAEERSMDLPHFELIGE